MAQPISVAEQKEQAPICYGRSCTECSRETVNGKPNVRRLLHHAEYRRTIDNTNGHLEWLDCEHCPIHIGTTTNVVGHDADGRPISEWDVLRMEVNNPRLAPSAQEAEA